MIWWASDLWSSDGQSGVLKWRGFGLHLNLSPDSANCVTLYTAHNLSEPPFAHGQNGDNRFNLTGFL